MAILVGTLKLLGSPVNMFGDSINCILITQISLFNRIDLWRREKVHEFHENCLSVTFYFMKKDSKRCCEATTPESIHTKDESKRGIAFAFIFGVN